MPLTRAVRSRSIDSVIRKQITMLEKNLVAVSVAGLLTLSQHAWAAESSPIASALVKGDIDYLEACLNGLQTRFENGGATELEIRDTYKVFYMLDPLQFQTLAAWSKRFPKSYPAHLATAFAYMKAASRARGGEFINETPDYKLVEMDRLMRIAAQEFRASLPLADKPYLSYYYMLDMFQMYGDFKGSRWATDQAEKILPHNYLVNTKYITTLEPKWGGSYDQMLAFIEERKKDSPSNEILALEAVYYNDRGQAAARNRDNRGAHDNYVEALKRANAVGGVLRRDYLNTAGRWVCSTTKEPEYCGSNASKN
jgi:hypothetical protein